MFFSIKAFNGTATRFENLDNVQELNDFVNEYTTRGFTKFVVKSYDQDGPRKVNFFSTVANHHVGTAPAGLGGFDGYAVRIGQRPLVEA